MGMRYEHAGTIPRNGVRSMIYTPHLQYQKEGSSRFDLRESVFSEL